MRDMLMHNVNVLVRMLFYAFWIWMYYFDGLHLSEAMRSFVNCLVLADIATWLLYQIYLLPRMVVHFGIGTVVNLLVMVMLVRGAKSLLPQTLDMQAMAAMVFFAVAGVKGFYYYLLEMSYV
jgi:hypothetical protein